MRQRFHVEGMHCKKCKAKIKASFLAMPEVKDVRIDVESGRTTLDAAEPLAAPVLQERLAAAGNYRLATAAPGFFTVLGRKIRKYRPLLIALGAVAAWTIIRQAAASAWDLHDAVHDFMSGFFLVFGGLKVANWRKFAEGFRGYDPLAARSKAYAYAYPAIEIALGLGYAFRFQPEALMNVVTIAALSTTSVGIFRVLARGGDVQCACLGGYFNIPISWLTVFENALMILMAGYMLIA